LGCLATPGPSQGPGSPSVSYWRSLHSPVRALARALAHALTCSRSNPFPLCGRRLLPLHPDFCAQGKDFPVVIVVDGVGRVCVWCAPLCLHHPGNAAHLAFRCSLLSTLDFFLHSRRAVVCCAVVHCAVLLSAGLMARYVRALAENECPFLPTSEDGKGPRYTTVAADNSCSDSDGDGVV
jgi:hypothetical protein